LSELELRMLTAARTRCHGARAERAVARLAASGNHGGAWLAIGVAGQLLDGERRAAWRRATGAVALSYLANSALKLLVARKRPVLEDLPPLAATPTQLSFPSAHAATSFAGALAYARLGLPAPALYALAASLALSRLYLGLHYPSDVLAGALLGTVLAALLSDRGARR